MLKVGDHVIVRAELAGVVYGELGQLDNETVTLTLARQLWSWGDDAALCVAQLAACGVGDKTTGHNISAPVPAMQLRRDDCTQIMTMTQEAVTSIDKVPSWTA